jgi:hypothetical protein
VPTKPKTGRVTAASVQSRKKSKLELKARSEKSTALRRLALPVASIAILVTGVVALSVPMHRRTTKRTNELQASRALAHLGTAEASYQERHPTKEIPWGAPVELPRLLESGYANAAEIGAGAKNGYVFRVQPLAGAKGWWAMARPEQAGATGDRVYYTNQTLNVVSVEIGEGEEPALPDSTTGAPPAAAGLEAIASR